ncbi:DUF6211 family protein [Kitasatospora sp. NPDC058263]
MVPSPDTNPAHEPADGPAPGQPWYGDLVTLRPGNSAGVPADCQAYVIADTLESDPTVYILYLPDDHPGHPDWAAAATVADLATVTRHHTEGVTTWSPGAR